MSKIIRINLASTKNVKTSSTLLTSFTKSKTDLIKDYQLFLEKKRDIIKSPFVTIKSSTMKRSEIQFTTRKIQRTSGLPSANFANSQSVKSSISIAELDEVYGNNFKLKLNPM